MDQNQVKSLLEQVAAGDTSVDDAVLRLRMEPFTDIDIANLDNHRALRQGVGEVIYGAGKTPGQIDRIAHTLWEDGQRTILITERPMSTSRAGPIHMTMASETRS